MERPGEHQDEETPTGGSGGGRVYGYHFTFFYQKSPHSLPKVYEGGIGQRQDWGQLVAPEGQTTSPGGTGAGAGRACCTIAYICLSIGLPMVSLWYT